LAALVATVAAIATIPLVWVAGNVADEDGWVEFTAGFVEDEQMRDGMIDAIVDAALPRTTLPSWLAGRVDAALQELVRTAAQRPAFRAAWRESSRRTHRLVLADGATADRLVADIGPLATFVVRDLSKELPILTALPDRLIVPIADQPDDQLIDGVRASADRSRIGLAVAGIAMVVSMVLAGGVGAALRRLGAVLVGGAAAIFVATSVLLPGLLDSSPAPSAFAHQMRALLVAQAAGSLDAWAVTLGVAGAVVIASGFAISRRS
jgi:hypothetical protein